MEGMMNMEHATVVTNRDFDRLVDLVNAWSAGHAAPLARFLETVLDRAVVVTSEQIGPEVVTMNTRLSFRDDNSGQVRTVTVVYPGEEDSAIGRISVLTPVGSALIGLSAGQSVEWQTLDGRRKRLTVLEILYQPEAVGRHDD